MPCFDRRRGRAVRFASALVALVALVALGSSSAADSTIDVGRELDGEPLGTKIAFIRDPRGAMTIDEVVSRKAAASWETSRFDAPSYGFVRGVIWVRLPVANRSSRAAPWLLEVAYPHLDRLELYAPRPGGGFDRTATGDRLPFAHREMPYRNFVFRLAEPPRTESVYYVRVSTEGAMTLPFVAWSDDSFVRHRSREDALVFMMYGLLLVMTVYNFAIFVRIREVDHLYYSLMTLTYLFFQATVFGHTFEYATPGDAALANHLVPFSVGLALAGFWQFGRRYLRLAERSPLGDRLLLAAIIAEIGLAAAAFVLPYTFATRSVVALGIVVQAVLVVVPVALALRGDRAARFVVGAFGVPIAGAFAFLLKVFGLAPETWFTQWGVHIGAVIAVTLLSFGLADRVHAMQRSLAQLNAALASKVDELGVALVRAEEATRAKGEFLATVSHELRAPLNAIINIPHGLAKEFRKRRIARCSACAGVFELEPDEVLTPTTPCAGCGRTQTLELSEQRVYTGTPDVTARNIGHVESSGRHLLAVVNDVLDASRLEAGRLTLERTPFDVAAMLRATLEPFEDLAASGGVGLELVEAPRSLRLVADELRIQQVVINLVGNAIKFSDGRGTVRVGARAERGGCRFWVSDEGIGIAPEDSERIFEPFEQVHRGDRRRYAGTGLGLAISKRFVDLHGGTIEVESALGHGSTFSFWIPNPGVPSTAPGVPVAAA